MFDGAHGLSKLCLILCSVQIIEYFLGGTNLLRHTNDFVKNSVLLILNNSTIVSERSNPQSLVFRTGPLEVILLFRTNKRDYSCRNRRPKRGGLAKFEEIAADPILIHEAFQRICLLIYFAVTATECNKPIFGLAKFKIDWAADRFKEPRAVAQLSVAVQF